VKTLSLMVSYSVWKAVWALLFPTFLFLCVYVCMYVCIVFAVLRLEFRAHACHAGALSLEPYLSHFLFGLTFMPGL
jgi:hypothetical protein